MRADGVVEFRFEIGDVIEAHEFDAGNQRRKRLAVFRGMRDAKARQTCGRERNFPAPGCAFSARRRWRRFCVSVGAGELQRAFNRFGAAIGEENAVEAGPFDELARERRLDTDCERDWKDEWRARLRGELRAPAADARGRAH